MGDELCGERGKERKRERRRLELLSKGRKRVLMGKLVELRTNYDLDLDLAGGVVAEMLSITEKKNHAP